MALGCIKNYPQDIIDNEVLTFSLDIVSFVIQSSSQHVEYVVQKGGLSSFVSQLIISLNQASTLHQSLNPEQLKLEQQVLKRLCKTIGFMCAGAESSNVKCQDALRDM
jgi:hypothetical protein